MEEPPTAVPAWRHPAVIVAGVAAILAVSLAVFALARVGEEGPVPAVNTLVRLDGDAVAAVAPVGSGPQAVAVQGGATVWWRTRPIERSSELMPPPPRPNPPKEGSCTDRRASRSVRGTSG